MEQCVTIANLLALRADQLRKSWSVKVRRTKQEYAEGREDAMTWNYRVIEHDSLESDRGSFAIHEVYYDEQGHVKTWTEKAVSVTAETVDALREELEIMAEAVKKPVLKESELLRETAHQKRLTDR